MKTFKIGTNVEIRQISARRWEIYQDGTHVFTTHRGEKAAREHAQVYVKRQPRSAWQPGDPILY